MNLLVDVDSKIPNLALMKISAYLKAKGEEVRLYKVQEDDLPEGQFFSVWISCVFEWNRETADYLLRRFSARSVKVMIGGTGWDSKIKLPDEIEWLMADYSLYGDDRAIGFVQRGCIRACDFCKVHEKEGWLKDNRYWPLQYWVPEGFKKILLLDNEFAAMGPPYLEKNIHDEVLDVVKKNDWKLSITQGYDLRCIADFPEKAVKLAENKPWDLKFTEKTLYTAWDYFAIEPFVHKAIRFLLEAGFDGREILVYCLVGHTTTHFQDLYRVHILWNYYGVRPFVMKFNKRMDDSFLNALARYANRGPASYRNHSFADYCAFRSKKHLEEAEQILSMIEKGEHPSYEILRS